MAVRVLNHLIMAKNHCINGVNWASLKKFARFYFGEENIIDFQVKEDKYYIVYMKEIVYKNNTELVEKFENKFHVYIRPMKLDLP